MNIRRKKILVDPLCASCEANKGVHCGHCACCPLPKISLSPLGAFLSVVLGKK